MSETATVLVSLLATIAAVMAGAGKHWIQGRRSKREGVDDDESDDRPSDSSITSLLEYVAEMRDDQVEDRQQIRSLWAEVRAMRSEIIEERSLRQVAIDYIGTLHAWIKHHLPGSEPPDVPDDLAPHFRITTWRNHED